MNEQQVSELTAALLLIWLAFSVYVYRQERFIMRSSRFESAFFAMLAGLFFGSGFIICLIVLGILIYGIVTPFLT